MVTFATSLAKWFSSSIYLISYSPALSPVIFVDVHLINPTSPTFLYSIISVTPEISPTPSAHEIGFAKSPTGTSLSAFVITNSLVKLFSYSPFPVTVTT